MNERIIEMAIEAGFNPVNCTGSNVPLFEKFAELIVRECIDKIETLRIPVSNTAAGEMACEWTYYALGDIRDKIKEHFGVEE
jgi:peroxiredoxin